MSKRKKRKRRVRKKVQAVFGVAWYKRAQWERLLQIAADRDDLEDTYQEWQETAEEVLRALERPGIVLRKVDVEELLSWCNAQNRPVDGAARSEFVAEKLQGETS